MFKCLELSNRSATLYHLERHEYALEDIEEASQLGYPKDLFYKLEERRARCLLGLKRHDEAIEAFRRALQALDDAKIPLERRQKFEADIRMMLAVMDKGKRLNEAAMMRRIFRKFTASKNSKSVWKTGLSPRRRGIPCTPLAVERWRLKTTGVT